MRIVNYTLALLFISLRSFGGNEERTGAVGATQLLINPFAQSSGLAGAATSNCTGVEASFWNIAGAARVSKSEMFFTRTAWLMGSDININAFGVAQKLKGLGTFSLNVTSMSLGEIEITTVNNPEGGIGTYKPQFMNIGVGYSKTFLNDIHGGINVKVISESIHNVSAFGIALDAGIQYLAGENDQTSFGIALKNVGPKMSYSGDGLKWDVDWINGNTQKGEAPSQSFDLPLLMNIGLGHRIDFKENHSLEASFTFSANAFTYNQYRLGLEYTPIKYLKLRVGYAYEEGILKLSTRKTAFTGPAGGFSVCIPIKKDGPRFAVDYSYRDTNPFSGVHTFGVRLNL